MSWDTRPIVGDLVRIHDDRNAANFSGVGKVTAVIGDRFKVKGVDDFGPQGDWGEYNFDSRRVEFLAGRADADRPVRGADFTPAAAPWVHPEAGAIWEVDTSSKSTNPKDAIGSDKLPIHLWPETATAMGCIGLLDGMLKYGRSNWREAGVRATIYIDAMRRHLAAWAEGEDNDPDSGAPHLAHIGACWAILVDAQAAGELTDDRQYNGSGYRRLVDELTPNVKRLKERHADKSPKHFTIADQES